MPSKPWTSGGGYFDTVADLYDARRPGYPKELFDEIAARTAVTSSSTVLEVGAGTGQATVRLAELGATVVALEPGPALAELAAQRVASFDTVEVVPARFEDWDPDGRRFDLIVAASCWHWLDPRLRWRKAHQMLTDSGWLALLAHVVIRDPGTPEVYAETADLHEAHHPGHPGWGHPQTAAEIIAEAERAAGSIADVERVIGRAPDPSSTDELFDPPLLLWRRQDQQLDARGYVELMRTMSLYGSLDDDVREPLLTAMEQRIRDRMHDHAVRSYLISARLARRRA